MPDTAWLTGEQVREIWAAHFRNKGPGHPFWLYTHIPFCPQICNFCQCSTSLRKSDHQVAAIKWLAAQPGGPAKALVISEEWSSDCRRDVPMLARLAEAGGLELRIFRRDGQHFSKSHHPTLAEAPDSNADIMAEFLNTKNGQTWQSIPVAVFYTKSHEYLYHYTEYPAIYHKDRVVAQIRAPKSGEGKDEAQTRGDRDFRGLQESPFFQVWASAGVDEILSSLHRRLLLGPSA